MEIKDWINLATQRADATNFNWYLLLVASAAVLLASYMINHAAMRSRRFLGFSLILGWIVFGASNLRALTNLVAQREFICAKITGNDLSELVDALQPPASGIAIGLQIGVVVVVAGVAIRVMTLPNRVSTE